MKPVFHYAPVSIAINNLRQQGFVNDFSVEREKIVCDKGEFNADEFEILDVYRYEGESDPGDEATVYAIQSKSGIKGILVTGYGASSDLQFKSLAKMH